MDKHIWLYLSNGTLLIHIKKWTINVHNSMVDLKNMLLSQRSQPKQYSSVIPSDFSCHSILDVDLRRNVGESQAKISRPTAIEARPQLLLWTMNNKYISWVTHWDSEAFVITKLDLIENRKMDRISGVISLSMGEGIWSSAQCLPGGGFYPTDEHLWR